MIQVMVINAAGSLRLLPLVALTALGMAVTALAFAGWLRFADVIILTLGESGLSTCF